MLTFAIKKKRTSPIAPKRHAPTVSPMSHSLHLQQAKVRHILRGPTLQAKLTIGQPNDKYEREADRVADEVMRMPEPGVRRQIGPEEEEEETLQTKPLAEQITPLVQVQRQEEPEEEEQIQPKPVADQITPLVQRQVEEEEEEPIEELEKEEEPIMTKGISGRKPQIRDDLQMRLNQIRGGGQPLPEEDRNFMERRFGVDFSGVRVHTDSNAAQLSRDLNAQAFTHGRDIHFGAGKYNPESLQGKKLLAHELTHVVQQTGGAPISQGNESSGQILHGGRHALTSRLNAASMPRTAESRARAAIALPSISWQAISVQPMIQRDFAIRPPRPNAIGRTLSAAKMKEAIKYNKKYLSNIPNSAGVIRMIRDVLGISPTPTVVNADFVNVVLDWQAMYRLTQDGKLGPSSARRLFRELGAEKEGQGKVKSGPRYSPQVPTVTLVGVRKRTSFRFNAEFESDPAKGIYPSCCEVRQFIRWNAAAVTSWGGPRVPHGGFPAAHPANRWIEDRDSSRNRYGHRSGPFSDPTTDDQYLDSSGKRNQAYGHIYRGGDGPEGPATDAGQWRFLVKVIDVCRGGRTIGRQDVIRINW